MTLIEIMIVMVIMALVATAAGFAIIPQLNKAKVKQTSTDAKAVASAAEMYMAEHDECPTVEQLVSEKILAKDKNTKDAWGNDFSIECDEDGATVMRERSGERLCRRLRFAVDEDEERRSVRSVARRYALHRVAICVDDSAEDRAFGQEIGGKGIGGFEVTAPATA